MLFVRDIEDCDFDITSNGFKYMFVSIEYLEIVIRLIETIYFTNYLFCKLKKRTKFYFPLKYLSCKEFCELKCILIKEGIKVVFLTDEITDDTCCIFNV